MRRALLPLLATALAATLFAAPAVPPAESKHLFDLPADTAERTLKRFAVQAGVDVVFAPEITDGVRTNAVHGEFSPRHAAERLLAGTGLSVVQDEKTGVLSVERTPKPAVPPRDRGPSPKVSVRGRVFNPATGEYVQNAEISVVGTDLATQSVSGGVYVLDGLPVGRVTLQAAYAGYRTTTASVTTTEGGSITQDFEILSTETAPKAGADSPVTLSTYVVSSQREGNAKAIMEQRNSMAIGSVVASDVFGEVSEGNVGEFLKYLPGVELEYVGDDARTPRLQGMGAQYTGVTLDGMSIASADANVFASGTTNTAAGQRSFGLDSISISSIESVEVNYVTGADQDANAPAGTINMRTKRAFDRKGRRISYQLYEAFNSKEDSFGGFYGGDDAKHASFRPGGKFEYSDVFFGNRLGLVLGVVESNIASFNSRHTLTYNSTPTATDPRPFVVTTITMQNVRKLTRRNTVTLTADYKLSPEFSAGITLLHNEYDAYFENQNQAYSGGRPVNTGNGLTDITVSSGNLTLTTQPGDKITRTYTAMPRFDYRSRYLEVGLAGGYSHADNHYEDGTLSAGANALAGLGYHVTRPGTSSAEWTITQTSGPDWADLSRFLNPRVSFRGQKMINDLYLAKLDAKVTLPWGWPAFIKAGGKVSEAYNRMDDRGPLRAYSYVGPGGGATGSFGLFPAPWTWTDYNGSIALSSSGRAAQHPNATEIAGVFQQHPEYFASTTTPLNWYNAMIANRVKVKETVNAAYLLGETRVHKLRLQAGLRWEGTRLTASEFDQVPASSVVAAGFPVDANHRPTTIAGYQYMFQSRPAVKRTGTYDNFFPSVSANWRLHENLIAQLGYNQTVARPAFTDVAGAWDWQDASSTVTVPNPGLKPERGEKFITRLSYYFEPVGSFSIGAYQNNLTDAINVSEGEAADFGFGDDPQYANYTFFYKSNVPGVTRTKGYTIDYSQKLGFLPKAFGAPIVFANYSRMYASRRLAGLPPHMVSGGVTLRFGRLVLSPNVKWIDETPSEATAGIVRKATIRLDFNAEYRLHRLVTVFVTAKNVFDEPDAFYRDNIPEKMYRFNSTGAYWTAGIKGAF